jgi:hypothetical protein
MNTDETQIKLEKDYSLSPITEQLIGAAFEVHNVSWLFDKFRKGTSRVHTEGL